MLIYKISDNLKLVFTPNRTTNYNSVIQLLDYAGSNGALKKNIRVNFSAQYTPVGSNKSEIVTRLDNDNVTTYILDDTVSFYYNGNNIGDFIEKLSYFGNDTFLKFKNIAIGSNISKYKNNSIKNDEGKIITFKNFVSEGDLKGIHKFIYYMKMDNGRMIEPLIKRYVTTLLLFRGKQKFLTGYANLKDYLTFIKNPSKEMLAGFTEAVMDADFVIEMASNPSEIRLQASEIIGGKLAVDLFVNGVVKDVNKGEEATPYVLLNSKPIKLLNQKLPYFVVKHMKVPVFVSPLMFKSDKALVNLRGGINLLK